MDHDQNPTECVHAQRRESLLAMSIGIFDGDGVGTAQCLLGVGETDLVLCEVCASLRWIELDLHPHIMHT